MESAFSHPLPERYCPYGVVPPSAGYAVKRAHAPFHPARFRHALPLLIYPHTTDQHLYDTSYPGATTPLMPYLGPFHGRFGVYECALEPAFIQKRNERERQRVKCVNQGYAKLREHIPGATADKRMSKVETLRAAIRYIKHLQHLVEEHEVSVEDINPERGDGKCQLSIISTPEHCCDAPQDSSGT